MSSSDSLGFVPEVDSSRPPAAGFPWHLAIALAAAWGLGAAGLHWSFVLPILWVLLSMDERIRRKLFAVMKRELIAQKEDKMQESVAWINWLLRAVWPMYEPQVSEYVRDKIKLSIGSYLERYPPPRGVSGLDVKKFSFGKLSYDRARRVAPLMMDAVKTVSKSDPTRSPIQVVMQADMNWHTGKATSVVLDIQLGHKLLSYSVEAEVRDVITEGTLKAELEWVKGYPYLGVVKLSFVNAPTVDFKLSIGGSPDVMDLAPPLRDWLKKMINESMEACMVKDQAPGRTTRAPRPRRQPQPPSRTGPT